MNNPADSNCDATSVWALTTPNGPVDPFKLFPSSVSREWLQSKYPHYQIRQAKIVVLDVPDEAL